MLIRLGEVEKVDGPLHVPALHEPASGSQRAASRAAAPLGQLIRNRLVRRRAQLKRFAFEPSIWDCPAAERECQVFGRTAQRRARPVRPVKVGGLEAASLNVDAEVGVPAALGKVFEDDPDGLVR